MSTVAELLDKHVTLTVESFDRIYVNGYVPKLQTSGQLVGFHPEGKRNLEGGPYDLLPAQPGIGKVIYAAHPQVIL